MGKWIYGVCKGRHARKHRRNKNVQFILWKAGEQGHKEDFWYDFDSSWWDQFQAYPRRRSRMDKSDWIMLLLATAIAIGSAYLWIKFFLN